MFVRGDVRDAKQLLKWSNLPARFFISLPKVAVTTSLNDPVSDFEINARGTLNVLEAIRSVDSPPPLVFTSTNKVYGNLEDVLCAPRRFEIVETPVPPPEASEVRVRLEGCGVCGSNLAPFEGRSWFQYPRPAGEPGHEGSGEIDAIGSEVRNFRRGERVAMRMTIARALIKNPEIIVLDEATASLDAESEALVQEALEKLMKGRTTFVIAHRLSTVVNADKIVVLKEGRVAEMGRHEHLMSLNGYYASLVKRQTRGLLQNEGE